jgi:hypothetical protein
VRVSLKNPLARTQTASAGLAGRRRAILELGLVAVAAALVYAWFFHNRGLDVPDEGLLLHVAERLADGQVPYRDVYFIYTPGFQYLLAALFKLLGTSLAVERGLLFAVHVALVLAVYSLAARLTWRPLALAAALAVMATGVTPYRTLAALVTALTLVRYAETARLRWLAATGLLIGTSYLVGQEIGAYTLAATLGYLALDWLSRPGRLAGLPQFVGRALMTVSLAAAVVAPWVAIMARQGALEPMVTDTLRVTFLHQPRYMHVPLPPILPLVPDDLSAQVVWGPPAYLAYVKVILYLPTICVAAAAGILGAHLLTGRLTRRDRAALPIALLAAATMGTLAFRADYYHARQILPVVLVLLAWLLGECRRALLAKAARPPIPPTDAAVTAVGRHVSNAEADDAPWTETRAAREQRGARRAAGAGSIALLPLTVILAASLGETWHNQGWLSAPLATPRGTVLVDATTAADLGGLLAALRARTASDEAIYVAPAETAVYFLAVRANPTRFGQIVSTELEVMREEEGRLQDEVVAAIEASAVRWVVAAPMDDVNGYPFDAYAPRIARYLTQHFEPDARFGYWTLLRRRE